MQSSNARIAAARRFLLFLTVFLISAPVSAAPLTSSGNGEVQVQVCRDETEDLAINSPGDGDELSNREMVLKAAVLNLSKADVFVQDRLRATIRLGETAVGFEYPLTLDAGRQKIKVVGYDLCGKEFHTESVTVYVEAPPELKKAGTTDSPSDSSLAETPATAATPVIFHEDVSAVGEKTEAVFGEPGLSGGGVSDPGASLLDKFEGWLDLGPTFTSFGNITRGLVALAGAFLVINAHILQRIIEPKALNSRGGRTKSSRRPAKPVHKYPHLRLYLRIAGALMLLSLFVV